MNKNNKFPFNAETIWRMMRDGNHRKVELLEKWAEFGRQVVNGAFHGNGDWDYLAAEATILIEDTEDELD